MTIVLPTVQTRGVILRTLIATCWLFCAAALFAADDLTLWYRQPAEKWTEALPVGNGRLGAMVFGGVAKERLQLNENTFWSGGPYDPANPDALAALPEARRLIFEGKFTEARDLIGARMMGKPLRQMSYQPIGDLAIEFTGLDNPIDYRRELNLDTAIATTTYRIGDVHFKREVFASHPDEVIVVRITANKPGQISFTARFSTPQQQTPPPAHPAGDPRSYSRLTELDGIGPAQYGIRGATHFAAQHRVIAERGKVEVEPSKVEFQPAGTAITGADAVTILISIGTSYVDPRDTSGDATVRAEKYLTAAAAKSFEELERAHLDDYRRLFRRVSLDLGSSEAANRPTDDRLKTFADGRDPQLAALMFQFGRYLLISSSRRGGQPATLQGLWNDRTDPPWGSKYTININT
ncbi:MAG TPA: glycoside hydrolase family 95 protein, partial [Pirellulales bacterium]|nr:glycoside hydrolase family 95 protein [Pirellulales bacterium]